MYGNDVHATLNSAVKSHTQIRIEESLEISE